MKKDVFIAALLTAIIFGLGIVANAQRPVLGGYSSIATDDTRVTAAADFAVNKRIETNSEQEGMTLESIDKAESQVVAGTNFRLCMTVALDDNTQQVSAIVFQSLKQEYSLKSWIPVDSCGGSTTGASSSAAPVHKMSLSNCTGAQLSLVGDEGDSDIGGKRYWNYVFTNISSRPCVLRGYPTFTLLNRSGRTYRGLGVEYTNDYPNSATQALGKRSRSVTLQPGKKAWFQIYYNDGMALEHTKPYPVIHRVRITAPHTTRRFVLKGDLHVCCSVQVSSLRKGSPGN